MLRGQTVTEWRDAAFSECDYAIRHARNTLSKGPEECRSFMIRTEDWKFILYEGCRLQLFDMKNDPDELVDLGEDPSHEKTRRQLSDQIFAWMRKRKFRTALSNNEIANRTGKAKERGYLFGVW